jgi:hypothetical protein
MRYSGIALLFGAVFADCAFFLATGWLPMRAPQRTFSFPASILA